MRLRYMLVKEVLQFRRNPALLRMAVFMPIMQTLILSFAANLDVTDVPVAIWDEDHSASSRDFVAKIGSSPYFVLVHMALDGEALQRDLDNGRAALAVHLPPHFGRDLTRGQARAQLLVDGSDSNTATVAATYVTGLATAYELQARLRLAARRGQRPHLPQIETRPRVFYNADLQSLWFMAPAILALVLSVLMQNLTALSIARERELGTLEQLVMTPIRPAELMLGKLIPYGVVGCVDAVMVSSFVVFILGVPFRGSVLVLAASIVLFLFATLGLGLLVSTVSANQQQASLTNFFLSFPSMLLSGFMFPISNLPTWLRPVSDVVPMSHFLEISRGCFLRGAGFHSLAYHLLMLAALSTCYFVLGALRFHKRLD